MRTAIIVYTILTVVMLIPWFAYNIKVSINLKKDNKKFTALRLAAAVLVTVVIIFAAYSHFRFTIGYQVPLVAERAGLVFVKRMEGKLDLSGYQAEMRRHNLSAADMSVASDEKWEAAALPFRHTGLHLSERTYHMEDGTALIYMMHESVDEHMYSFLKMSKSGYSWLVEEHGILTEEEFENANEEMKIRFYPIR